jgi:hypothetical protein
MPAKSKAQQAMFGIADAIQKGEMAPKPGSPSAKIAATVAPASVKDFASTPAKALPKRVALPPNPGGMKVNQTPTGGGMARVPGSKFRG